MGDSLQNAAARRSQLRKQTNTELKMGKIRAIFGSTLRYSLRSSLGYSPGHLNTQSCPPRKFMSAEHEAHKRQAVFALGTAQ